MVSTRATISNNPMKTIAKQNAKLTTLDMIVFAFGVESVWHERVSRQKISRGRAMIALAAAPASRRLLVALSQHCRVL
jgi:hypothetical protein